MAIVMALTALTLAPKAFATHDANVFSGQWSTNVGGQDPGSGELIGSCLPKIKPDFPATGDEPAIERRRGVTRRSEHFHDILAHFVTARPDARSDCRDQVRRATREGLGEGLHRDPSDARRGPAPTRMRDRNGSCPSVRDQ